MTASPAASAPISWWARPATTRFMAAMTVTSYGESEGDDRIFGDAGDDNLIGGAGNDTLASGTGADTFTFEHDAGIDTIKDFSIAEDTIAFDRAAFGITEDAAIEDYVLFSSSKTLPTAPGADHGYFLVSSTGAVWWDADGTGSEAAVAITRFGVETPGLTAASFEFALTKTP